MKSIIISIGDELLIGQVINTNAAYIAQKLNHVGIDVTRMITVGDDEPEILKAFQESIGNAEVTVVTGGLGPTHDDITKKAVCEFFKTDLVMSNDALQDIAELLKRRNLTPTQRVQEQALVPRNASIIRNAVGTAPGLLIEQHDRHFFILPGVPLEMQYMVDSFIVPYFQRNRSGQVIFHRTLNTTGISESALAECLGDLHSLLGSAKLAFLPATSGVRLRITVGTNDQDIAEKQSRQVESSIRSKAGKYIYGVDDETLEQVVGSLLRTCGLTLSIAESCTGGLISHRITNVSGSSRYFDRAVVAYNNQTKLDTLGVPGRLIDTYGAVSKEVAEAMASGIRRAEKTHLGISTTGIAGPTGGSPEKPVGLVWIGFSDERETVALKFHFGNDRIQIKERAAQAALELVRKKILNLI